MLQATDLLNRVRQGQMSQAQVPVMPQINPQIMGRVPLRFGGRIIPVNHPLYDLIKRIILERYQGPQAPMGSQG